MDFLVSKNLQIKMYCYEFISVKAYWLTEAGLKMIILPSRRIGKRHR
jgi:hypothetical protein